MWVLLSSSFQVRHFSRFSFLFCVVLPVFLLNSVTVTYYRIANILLSGYCQLTSLVCFVRQVLNIININVLKVFDSAELTTVDYTVLVYYCIVYSVYVSGAECCGSAGSGPRR